MILHTFEYHRHRRLVVFIDRKAAVVFTYWTFRTITSIKSPRRFVNRKNENLLPVIPLDRRAADDFLDSGAAGDFLDSGAAGDSLDSGAAGDSLNSGTAGDFPGLRSCR